jgi:amino acid transporter
MIHYSWLQGQKRAQRLAPSSSQLLWYIHFNIHTETHLNLVSQVGIRTLNHVINAAILVFVMSAANSDLYIGSRTLYGLAIEGKAPSVFKKVNRMGVPYPSLILCTAFCGLVFLNVSSSSAKGKAFVAQGLQLRTDIIHQYLRGSLIWSRRLVPSRGCVSHTATC